MVADTGPIGGNLSHEFIILASTGESEVFCHSDYLDFEVPDENVDFDDRASLQKTVDKWTSLYAATSEKHDAAAFEAIPQAKQLSARGHRGWPHLLLRHEVFGANEGDRGGARGWCRASTHGVVRHRAVTTGRRNH